jgi:hypothetical protein
MKRFIVLGFAVFAAVGAIAGPAAGRGGDWTPVTSAPFDTLCGATTVHVSFPVSKEFQQVTTLPDGTQLTKVTGSLFETFATDAGASLTINSSGPTNNGVTFNPSTGDFEFAGTGLNTLFLSADQAAATGLPEIFSTTGPVDILFRGDGTTQVKQLNMKTLTDICAALGAS